ncbi:MAG: hypothetical protein ACKV2V_31455 [Blastocatellia bacterium]
MSEIKTDLNESRTGRLQRKTMAAMLIVPIWLIFILLSPLNAWLAAKDFIR